MVLPPCASVVIPLLLGEARVSPQPCPIFLMIDFWIWTHRMVLPAGWSRTG